ncbi:SDR family NAD(P)-dependent oxidoreductase [Oceanibacterium hippocampi]
MTGEKGVALVVGAGESTGEAVARRFAATGHFTCMARRNGDRLAPIAFDIERKGGRARGFNCDARREADVVALFDEIEDVIGPLEVVVHNVGGNVRYPILETTTQKYFKVWEMACFSGFLVGREAARRMGPRGRGTIIFTGATASVRGGTGYAAFAGAKHGLRALAQSMARELGPKGIHVAHAVIDGPIDTPFIREGFPDMVAARPADGLLSPEAIAEAYYALHQQTRSAWSHEVDFRPWVEPW